MFARARALLLLLSGGGLLLPPLVAAQGRRSAAAVKLNRPLAVQAILNTSQFRAATCNPASACYPVRVSRCIAPIRRSTR